MVIWLEAGARMTEKVTLKNNHECLVKIKGDHINLESAHEILRQEFVEWCNLHNYKAENATIKLEKDQHQGVNFTLTMHIHLNKHDYHAQAINSDLHKALKDCLHTMHNNIAHHKGK